MNLTQKAPRDMVTVIPVMCSFAINSRFPSSKYCFGILRQSHNHGFSYPLCMLTTKYLALWFYRNDSVGVLQTHWAGIP